MKTLGFADVAVVVAVWLAVIGIAFVAKDGVVTLVACAGAYYLSKWTILKKES